MHQDENFVELSLIQIILIDVSDEKCLTISNDLNNYIDTKNIGRP